MNTKASNKPAAGNSRRAGYGAIHGLGEQTPLSLPSPAILTMPEGNTARRDASAKVSRAWAWLMVSFVLVGIVISGLYALTCMPYCPPVDRRLGIEEQLNVWGFILLLSAVEIVIGVRLTFILLSKLSYKNA